MAKRKRTPGSGPKLHSIKDYRSQEYTLYIFKAETGILQAWTINPDLRDGDVRETLRSLISSIKKTGQLPAALTAGAEDSAASDEEDEVAPAEMKSFIEYFILINLAEVFQENGPLSAEDTIGILSVINNSVGAWNRGLRGQEYLKYIKDFLGGMGVKVWQLSDEEVERLELVEPEKPERKKLWGLL